MVGPPDAAAPERDAAPLPRVDAWVNQDAPPTPMVDAPAVIVDAPVVVVDAPAIKLDQAVTVDMPIVIIVDASPPDAARDVAADMATPDMAVATGDTATPDTAADLAAPDTSPDVSPPDISPDTSAPDTTPDADPSALCTPSGPRPALKKTEITDGLAKPIEIVAPPDEPNTLWVLEHRSGRVRVIQNGVLSPTALAQVTVASASGRNTLEEGLYSIALHPDYVTNKLFYLFYSADDDPDYSTTVDEFVKNGATATRVRNVYSQPSNHWFHNGGAIAFHPVDKQLHISVGDNQRSGDAQDQEGTLGRVLRINLNTKAGTTVHYGLRNPWRFSFDAQNGDFYVGDVGDSGSTSEKVFYSKVGSPKTNFGWGGGGSRPPALDQTGAGTPIIGGFVYRGTKMPGLCGYYVYGRNNGGPIKTLKVVNNLPTQVADSAISTSNISSLGVDAAGELYFSELDGRVFRIDPQ